MIPQLVQFVFQFHPAVKPGTGYKDKKGWHKPLQEQGILNPSVYPLRHPVLFRLNIKKIKQKNYVMLCGGPQSKISLFQGIKCL
jgi:hypothetical protein